MLTIKVKKEMNLAELIEWGWKNKENMKCVEGKNFKSTVRDRFGNYSTVQFSVDGYGVKTEDARRGNTFTVEIEEEITEDTEIRALVELSSSGLLGRTKLHRNETINNMVDNASVAFYILNDDQTMDLIWRDGKLVD